MTDRPTLEQLGGWPAVLGPLSSGHDLDADLAHAALCEILAGEASDARIAGLIVGLRIKGETIDEVSGMVDAMLDTCEPITLPDGAVDIVGTGGSPTRRLHALNVSTMASLVAAAAGVPVCKHGNRKASSTSGSFDLLDELGVAIELDAEAVATCVHQVGVGFAFARAHHPAMRFVGPVRAELGIPTVFNLLGPLSHPGRVQRQVIGVGDARVVDLVAGVLASRGAPRAMVVHGADSLDEITLTGPTTVHEVVDGHVRVYELQPADLGLAPRSATELRGGDPAANAELARGVFAGEQGAVRDIVLANAAAGLWVGGVVDTLTDGIDRAAAAIDSGRVQATLERLVQVSNEAVSGP
jgi:anthranilate phosphoribosyltransferase